MKKMVPRRDLLFGYGIGTTLQNSNDISQILEPAIEVCRECGEIELQMETWCVQPSLAQLMQSIGDNFRKSATRTAADPVSY
jgi:hypothetical protein